MALYGKAAVRAFELIQSGHYRDPEEAWFKAVKEYTNSKSSVKKGCPRGAFLGLCEEGIIAGVPKGIYTDSELNKGYALEALRILRETNYTPTRDALWNQIVKVNKAHNGQMDVVLSLWESGYIQ